MEKIKGYDIHFSFGEDKEALAKAVLILALNKKDSVIDFDACEDTNLLAVICKPDFNTEMLGLKEVYKKCVDIYKLEYYSDVNNETQDLFKKLDEESAYYHIVAELNELF